MDINLIFFLSCTAIEYETPKEKSLETSYKTVQAVHMTANRRAMEMFLVLGIYYTSLIDNN